MALGSCMARPVSAFLSLWSPVLLPGLGGEVAAFSGAPSGPGSVHPLLGAGAGWALTAPGLSCT